MGSLPIGDACVNCNPHATGAVFPTAVSAPSAVRGHQKAGETRPTAGTSRGSSETTTVPPIATTVLSTRNGPRPRWTPASVREVSGGGNLDGPGGYWDTSSKQMCQALPYQSLGFLGDRPAVIYALHACRGPTLVFNGQGDTVVAMPRYGEPFFQDLRDRVVGIHGSATGVFETGFVPGNAGHRPYFVTRPVVQWLERHIDFPNWTDETIRSMAQVKISTWAAKNGVLVDRLYATEDREGGTMALGDDIPGYVPEMLDALSSEGWQSQREAFVLETWLEVAQANVTEMRIP